MESLSKRSNFLFCFVLSYFTVVEMSQLIRNRLYKVVVQNTQSSPTPAPFQQLLTLDLSDVISQPEELLNLRFCADDGCQSPLYAWVESYNSDFSSVYIWVKIPYQIPASSQFPLYISKQSVIQYPFTGMAPQLTATYAQYDNGENVFNFYDNFAGTSLNTNKWQVVSSGTYSAGINNGLNVSLSVSGSGYYLIFSKNTFNPPFIVENLFSSSTFTTDLRSASPALSSTIQVYDGADDSSSPVIDWSINSANVPYWAAQQGDSSTYFYQSTGNNSPASNWLLGIGYTGSTNYWYGFNGSTYTPYYIFTSSSQYSPTGSMYIVVGATSGPPSGSGPSTNITFSYTWVRARQYPPNGVMPSLVAFLGV